MQERWSKFNRLNWTNRQNGDTEKSAIYVPLKDFVLVMMVSPYHILWFFMLQAVIFFVVHVINLVSFLNHLQIPVFRVAIADIAPTFWVGPKTCQEVVHLPLWHKFMPLYFQVNTAFAILLKFVFGN